MTDKRTLAQLEKVFAGEIEGRDVQLPKKTADKLERLGFIKRRITSSRAGPFAMTVEFHDLTHLGRITYCESCSEEEP